MGFSIRRVNALLLKEIKDLGKNINILFMCLLPIIFSVLYSKLLVGEGPNNHLGRFEVLILCVGMNLVLVASFVIAMMIAEEKEKNTLRTLLLSGMSPLEFLTGKLLITTLLTTAINIVMFFIVGLSAQYLLEYIIFTTLVVISMVEIGAIIGIVSPNQMATGVVGMPVMMFLLLIPMFARLDKTIMKIAEFLPNYNMNVILEKVFMNQAIGSNSFYSIAVICIWIIITGVGFVYTYNKVGLDK